MITGEDIKELEDNSRKEFLQSVMKSLEEELNRLPSGVRPSWVSAEEALLSSRIQCIKQEIEALDNEI